MSGAFSIFAKRPYMNYILFDGPHRDALLPLTYTRPVAELRVGILTLTEKWNRHLDSESSFLTESYLQQKFPLVEEDTNILIQASVIPTRKLADAVAGLKPGEALVSGDTLIAFNNDTAIQNPDLTKFTNIDWEGDLHQLRNTWDLFALNGAALEADYELVTSGRQTAATDETVTLINPERIFIEEGASLSHCILNATEGAIYIGAESEVMEGSIIRGGFAMGPHSVVKMGARIYGPTSAGPHCKLGGEINNSVFLGYASKGHDGFLGNSVLGEWCNLGADTNTSNLKNNYAKVRLWNYASGRFDQTGLQFCGLVMGDHSKTAINTMLNTGTVIGVNTNVYSVGFPRNFIPSFSWGGGTGYTTYTTAKAFDTAKIVMARRGVEFGEEDAAILAAVFEASRQYRNYQ